MEIPSPAAAEAGAKREPSPEAPLAAERVGCARTPQGSARQAPASGASGADASPWAPAVLSPAPQHRPARGRALAAPCAQAHLAREHPAPLQAGNPSSLGSRWSLSAGFAAQHPVMPEHPGTCCWGAARATPNVKSCCFSPSLPLPCRDRQPAGRSGSCQGLARERTSVSERFSFRFWIFLASPASAGRGH